MAFRDSRSGAEVVGTRVAIFKEQNSNLGSSATPLLLVTTLRNLSLLSWLSHNGLRVKQGGACQLMFNTSSVVKPLLSANLMRLSHKVVSAGTR